MALISINDLNGHPEDVAAGVNMAKKLSDMYDEFLQLEQEKPDDGSRPPGIHASELYPCLRKPVYSLTQTEPRRRVAKFWLQRFKVGTAIHEMLQNDFKRMAKRSAIGMAMRVAEKQAEELNCRVSFEAEVPVSPHYQELAKHYQLYSHCDGVFTFSDHKTDAPLLRVGLEIKTEAPDQYDKLKEPKPEHMRQAHLYMAALDLPLLWFLYMNKGNQNNTNSNAPYLVVWQPKIWEEIEDRMKTVHQLVADGVMPERSEGIWCEFCPWSWTCQPKNLYQPRPRPPSRRDSIRSTGE